jgi:4-hydroxy-tetrahydrodipicolinate reductase
MIRVCLVGLGKTGKEIARVLLEQRDMKLVAAICSSQGDKKGKDLGEILGSGNTGVTMESSEDLEAIIFRTKPDVVIDFSNPKATIRNARTFSRMKVNIVVGTTGFTKFALRKLQVLTRKYHNGIVYAPNITLGVNVLMVLSSLASSILSNYDFQITEVHHRQKKDAPSGTAVKLAGEIQKSLASAGAGSNVNIPITAIRAGGVVGKHEVLIVGENDQIEISHESFSRKAFALGALHAVIFMYKKTGYFEMNDVLNLRKVLGDYLDKEKSRLNKRFGYYETGNAETIESMI